MVVDVDEDSLTTCSFIEGWEVRCTAARGLLWWTIGGGLYWHWISINSINDLF